MFGKLSKGRNQLIKIVFYAYKFKHNFMLLVWVAFCLFSVEIS